MNIKSILSGKGVFRIGKALRLFSRVQRERFLLIIVIFALLGLSGCTSYIKTEIALHQNEEWKAKTQLLFTPQQLVLLGGEQGVEKELQKEVERLESRNIQCIWNKKIQRNGGVNYVISLEGKGVEELRRAAPRTVYMGELLTGPISLHMEGNVKKEQALSISLKSNLSTGYRWQVEEIDRRILRQVGGFEFKQESKLLGAPAKQTLHFEAVGAGRTRLKLIYHRPWEKDAEPTREIFIQAVELDLVDLLNLSSQLNNTIGEEVMCSPCQQKGKRISKDDLGINLAKRTSSNEIQSQVGLPSEFDWRDFDGVTPVKDQGGCGSCWAFGTVGPLECNIKIREGIEEDLSEQYLVSCNMDGWSCLGGWWAHSYHCQRFLPGNDYCNKIPPGESRAGAVLEEDFPYEGEDVACFSPYNHPYINVFWDYVVDDSSVPPVDSIKQAIYTYGPISTAVCAGDAFQDYTGGVFETDESEMGVNHAIVLVGWDDNQGANGVWLLRNSWGSSWGEDGYMRIGYGISKVGYSANYIIYPALPPYTTLIDYPMETVTGNTLKVGVTFTWIGSDADNITPVGDLVYQYKLEGHPDYSNWSNWLSETSKTYMLSSENYTFKVRAKDEAGNYPEEDDLGTAKHSFVVSLPIIISPNPCYLNKGEVVTIANLSLNSNVKIYIYDLVGNLIRTLGENDATIEGGSKTATWDCKNDNGEAVAGGIYIYFIPSATEKKTGKIAIIK